MKIIGKLLLLLSFLMLYSMANNILRSGYFFYVSESEKATVTGYIEKNDIEGKSLYSPIGIYLLDEKKINFIAKTGYKNKKFSVGQEIQVMFDPKSPDSVEIEDYWELWMPTWLSAIFFFVLNWSGGAILLRAYRDSNATIPSGFWERYVLKQHHFYNPFDVFSNSSAFESLRHNQFNGVLVSSGKKKNRVFDVTKARDDFYNGVLSHVYHVYDGAGLEKTLSSLKLVRHKTYHVKDMEIILVRKKKHCEFEAYFNLLILVDNRGSEKYPNIENFQSDCQVDQDLVCSSPSRLHDDKYLYLLKGGNFWRMDIDEFVEEDMSHLYDMETEGVMSVDVSHDKERVCFLCCIGIDISDPEYCVCEWTEENNSFSRYMLPNPCDVGFEEMEISYEFDSVVVYGRDFDNIVHRFFWNEKDKAYVSFPVK